MCVPVRDDQIKPDIDTACIYVCVPVRGDQIKPDPLATKNSKRRDFCAKHDGYGDFCDGL